MRHARLAVVALVLGAGMLRAQDSKALGHDLDVAVARRDSARRALNEYHARRPVAAFTDTILLGGTAIRIVATKEASAIAGRAAEKASAALSRRLGAGISFMPPTTLYARMDSNAWSGKVTRTGMLTRDKVEAFNRDATSEDALAASFAMLAQEALVTRIDSNYRRKIGAALPMDTVTDDEWASIRATLATSYSPVAVRCLNEDVRACRLVLGVDSAVDQVMSLFDAPGRRAYVRQSTYGSPLDRVAQEDCAQGHDAMCVLLMRRIGGDLVIGHRGHATLASEAYRMGGADAFARLMSARGSETQILEAIAQKPTDSVVADWAHRMHTRGAISTAFSVRIAAVAIGWLILFLGLALRSSRWR